MKYKADGLLLGISIGGFLNLAISFLLMPIEGLMIASGILFWGGLIVGVAMQIILGTRRKALFAQYNVKCKTMQKARNGLMSFGSNHLALSADILMIVSAIATVVVFALTKGTGYVCYISLSVLVFSFCMHCILNGRICFYIRNQKKVQQALERKKANSEKKGERKQ